MSTSSPLYSLPPGHYGLTLARYRTTGFRPTPAVPPQPNDLAGASYFLYVPSTHPVSRRAGGEDTLGEDIPSFPLVVVVHGSHRNAGPLRDRWSRWAEEQQCVILAPQFPVDHWSEDGVNNYKKLLCNPPGGLGPIRYDLILLQMIEEVARIWRFIDTDQFSMLGFSGGGQFATRFLYLHPERLHAVAIGAPGQKSSIDQNLAWPNGTKDTMDLFGIAVDPVKISRVKLYLTVGGSDVAPRSNATITRVQTLQDMSANFTALDIKHEVVIVPDVTHSEIGVLPGVAKFMTRHVPGLRRRHGDTPAALPKTMEESIVTKEMFESLNHSL